MKSYYKQILSLSILLFFLIPGKAQTKYGSIQGEVLNSSGDVLPDANVVIKGTGRGASTNDQGKFEIKRLSAGRIQLQVSLVGYEIVTQTVTIQANETSMVKIILTETSGELEQVVIMGTTEGYVQTKPAQSLRIAENLFEAPQNIQVIGQALLQDQQAFDMLESITRNVSGVQRNEHWDNYAAIQMRGSRVTAFRNGMNVSMPFGPLTEDMSMVERIEFVKGPAGFMMANGEPSGFYNVVTKKPSGQSKGAVNTSLGSYNLLRTTIDLDGKFKSSDKLLYRINAMGQLKGSHRDFEYNNRYSIAPVIKYQMNDQTALTIEYNLQFSQMNVIGSNYAFSNSKKPDLPISFTTAESNLAPTKISDQSALLILEHALGTRWKLTTQAGYFHYKQVGQSLWPSGETGISQEGFMQRGISIWDALGLNTTGQIFLQGSERTGFVTHRILSGIDLGNKEYFADWSQGGLLGDSTFNIYEPKYGLVESSKLPKYDRSQNIRSRGILYGNRYASIYVQDELIMFNNNLRLTLAGRYTTTTDNNPYSGNSENSKLTPRVGLSYSIGPNIALYGLYDEAFLPNYGVDYLGKSFDPITGGNVEFGIKYDFMDAKWQAAASAYKITKRNVLVQDFEHLDPDTNQPRYSKQVGQTQAQGVEFDLRGEIVRNLSLILNYAYTDAKITEDTDESNIGKRTPGATKHIANAWLQYRVSDGALKGWGASVGYMFQGDRSTWYVLSNDDKLPTYNRVDAVISYAHDKFNIALNVNNVLDEYLYVGGPYDINFDGNTEYYFQAEAPINFRISVGYTF